MYRYETIVFEADDLRKPWKPEDVLAHPRTVGLYEAFSVLSVVIQHASRIVFVHEDSFVVLKDRHDFSR